MMTAEALAIITEAQNRGNDAGEVQMWAWNEAMKDPDITRQGAHAIGLTAREVFEAAPFTDELID